MRALERVVIRAFVDGKSCVVSNTSTDGRVLLLHGNRIAERRDDGTIWATLAGWPTHTTRSRLNALAHELGNKHTFYQDKGKQRHGIRQPDGDIPSQPISDTEWIKLT